MSGSGPDVTRSASDHYAIERVFLPTAFSRPEVNWSNEGNHISMHAPGISPISLEITPTGRAKAVSMLRWGNPDGGGFGLFPFAGYIDEESTWDR